MHYRPYRSRDFEECAALIPRGFRIRPELRASLPSIWRRLHRAGQLNGGVAVDSDKGVNAPVLSFGLTVFLDDRFVREYLDAPYPYVTARVYELMAKGKSPVVRAAEIAAANARAALNLLILHFGIRYSDPTDERWPGVVMTMHSGFQLSHVGYGVKRLMQEVYGEEVKFLTAGGFLLKSDYQAHYGLSRRSPPADAERPYLMGLFRDDPESVLPGSAASYLFRRVEPRFYFSSAARRVLLHALTDESDATIAGVLGISRDAVKKTWRRIHERMEAVAPDWSVGLSAADDRRGKERRRRLIQYLRYHLEELRPFASAAAPKPRRRR